MTERGSKNISCHYNKTYITIDFYIMINIKVKFNTGSPCSLDMVGFSFLLRFYSYSFSVKTKPKHWEICCRYESF